MNQASNFPMSSIASDINLHIAMRSRPELQRMGVENVNLIHDQFLLDMPPDYDIFLESMDIIEKHRKEVPIEFLKTDVPFLMDLEVSINWSDPITTLEPSEEGADISASEFSDWKEEFLMAA